MNSPNIIIFNPDQWRSDVLGCHGNPAAVTPFIDDFVSNEAVSFSNAFCQNPVCTPSRCSFMTGWYPHVRGHRTMFHMLHPEYDEPNLLKILKDEGYFVWWGGKNDLVPGQDGYEKYCDIKFHRDDQKLKNRGLTYRKGLHGTVDEWRKKLEDDNIYNFFAGVLDQEDEEYYCDDDWAIVLGAIDFIQNYDGDKPYCIFMPLQYPHPPYGVEQKYFNKIDQSKLPPRVPATENPETKPMILDGIRQGQKTENYDEEFWNNLRAVYYGMCTRLDDQFRLLMDALKKEGQYDNSAVFFFSDHGDFTGDYSLVEKTQNTFEDCLTKVPFIIKPPKVTNIIAGVNEELVELVDFPATVYDLLNLEVDYDHFGKSLLPIMAGDVKDIRAAAFCEGGRMTGEVQASESQSYNENSLYLPRIQLQISDEKPWHGKAVMCRTRNYKYVSRYYENDEFYDLTKDPSEQFNQIKNQEYAAKIAEHKQILLEWYMATCDVVPRKVDRRW